ncbi:sodium/calcium exchanger NCL2-like protein, partial [Tanacetum coccineum]
MIAQTCLNYNEKDQEANAFFYCKEKEIEAKLNILELNEALAVAFRQKCTNPTDMMRKQPWRLNPARNTPLQQPSKHPLQKAAKHLEAIRKIEEVNIFKDEVVIQCLEPERRKWHEYEVNHGNEDTFRGMLRIKSSVSARHSQIDQDGDANISFPELKELLEDVKFRQLTWGKEQTIKQVMKEFDYDGNTKVTDLQNGLMRLRV